MKEEKKPANWIFYANAAMMLLLICALIAVIFTGSEIHHFTMEWRERSDIGRAERHKMMAHDSAADKRGDALLKGQIQTHIEITRLQKQVDSLTDIIIYNKK